MTARVRIDFVVNAMHVSRDVEPYLTAVDLLRDEMGLTGTKVGCGVGECGSCTILVDGRPLLACLLLAPELHGTTITTIEGLADGDLSPLQQRFLDASAYQCGYCTPGMIIAASVLPPTAGESAVRAALAGNICRCTGYVKIVEAIRGVEGER